MLKDNLTPDSWNIASFIFYDMTNIIIRPIDGLVVFDTPPQVCLERIRTRGRPEEAEIDIEFLQKFHKRLFRNVNNDREQGTPVLVLNNTDCDNETNYEKLKNFVQEKLKNG